MNIATLTFHNAMNYGAVLQAYALQKAIEADGHRTEILNYSCPKVYSSTYTAGSGLKGLASWIVRRNIRKKKKEKFDYFIRKNVKLSPKLEREDLKEYCKRYDSVLVGSDQVWNTDITGDDRTFFLDFIPSEKKKSYAASIGLKSWNSELEPELAEALSDFSCVTVRENSSADYLSNLIGYRPQCVSDPVFLLSEEEWSQIVVEPQVDDSYVLCYSFGKPSSKLLNWSKAQAKALGVKLAVIHFGPTRIPGVMDIRSAGPEEFLGWLSKAQLVISPSFHACAFSIIFGINFYWFSDEENKLQTARSGRIEDLLSLYNLPERKVSFSSKAMGNIDYSLVNEIKDGERKRSLGILGAMLSNA